MNSRCFWKNTYKKVLFFPLCQAQAPVPGIYLQQSWEGLQHVNSAYWIQSPRPGTPPLTLAIVGCGCYPSEKQATVSEVASGSDQEPSPLFFSLLCLLYIPLLFPPLSCLAPSSSHISAVLALPRSLLSSSAILLSLVSRSSTQPLSSGQCSQQHYRPAVRIF